jgi:hemoglobin-like flavoprotein
MASENLIERSFELAAGRCEDLTPLYDRLFREHPETRTMFRTEGSELVKGSMLALTIEAILDFAGSRTGHFRLIECEISSHDAYGTPRDLFIAFFGVIAQTLREILGRTGRPGSMRRGETCSARSRLSWHGVTPRSKRPLTALREPDGVTSAVGILDDMQHDPKSILTKQQAIFVRVQARMI